MIVVSPSIFFSSEIEARKLLKEDTVYGYRSTEENCIYLLYMNKDKVYYLYYRNSANYYLFVNTEIERLEDKESEIIFNKYFTEAVMELIL